MVSSQSDTESPFGDGPVGRGTVTLAVFASNVPIGNFGFHCDSVDQASDTNFV